MKFLNFDEVLCLSPHPDDVEYSMSITIQKYKDTKFNILCMGNGGEGDSTSQPYRVQEAKQFWKQFPCSNIELHFETGYFNSKKEHEWVKLIETTYLSKAQCIMSTSPNDTHPDHRMLGSIVMQLSRKNVMSIIEYRSPSTTKDWTSNLTVPVTESELVSKINALRNSFSSQIDALYFDADIIQSFHIDFYDFKRGISKAEFFRIGQLNYF